MATHLSLQAALQQLGGGQTQNEIQLALLLSQQTQTDHATQQGLGVELTVLRLLVHGQQLTGRSTHLGQHVLNAPHFTLVLQTVLTDQLHLGVQALLYEDRSGVAKEYGTCQITPCSQIKHIAPLKPETYILVGALGLLGNLGVVAVVTTHFDEPPNEIFGTRKKGKVLRCPAVKCNASCSDLSQAVLEIATRYVHCVATTMHHPR